MTIINDATQSDHEADVFDRMFAHLDDEQPVTEGSVICAEGDHPDRWWYIVEGVADVTCAGRYLATVGPGETIGEMAMLDGVPRNATITAKTRMVLRTQPMSDFEETVRADAGLGLSLARQLARRMRRLTDMALGELDRAESTPARDGTAAPSASGAAEPITFNPFAPGYFEDPSVQMNAIREQDRVHESELLEGFIVTRYDDVHALARDRRFSNGVEHALPTGPIVAERAQIAADPRQAMHMLRRNGDDHTRLRRLVSKAFTPKAINLWRERTQQVADDLLDALSAAGGGDLIADYALLLPVQIISDMLGVPTDDVGDLRRWSHRLAQTVDPLSTPEARTNGAEAGMAMSTYFEALYAEKSAHPDDGLFSALIRAQVDDQRLTFDEVIANVLLLYVAGHETTTNLIGNGVVELLRHPEQFETVLTTPDLDANLVEEVLRFNSPVQATRRFPLEDVVIGDTHIPAGTAVLLSAAAANRDPRKWGSNADSFVVDRPGANDHVSFGGGPHFCLGAVLARLEGQIALPRIVRRFPKLATTVEPTFEQRMILRGVGSLPFEL